MSFKQHDKRGVIGGKVNGFTLARAHTVHTRVVADAVQKFLARPTRRPERRALARRRRKLRLNVETMQTFFSRLLSVRGRVMAKCC
jgi:hypothetical protein